MNRFQRMVAAVTVCLTITAVGYAKPGNGNGGGNGQGNGGNGSGGSGGGQHQGGGKGGSKDTATTFVVGTVSSTDSRILDATGDYEFSVNGTTVSISIVQDSKGKFTAEGSVINADGTTSGPVKLNGHLQLTGQTRLRIQLNGGGDDLSMHIRGDWNGTAFPVTIKIESSTGNVTGSGELVPVNPARGFTISDGALAGSKGKLSGNRTVTLPWGTQSISVKQQNKKSSVTFTSRDSTFGIDLRGTVQNNTTFSPTRAKLKLGYGSLTLSPSDVTVTGSAL